MARIRARGEGGEVRMEGMRPGMGGDRKPLHDLIVGGKEV